jgi:uncharacterized protein (TIGR02145 family)
MKNQKKSKRLPLWGCKGLLSVALSGLAVSAFAQSADICAGTPYTIASTVDASGASTYQWLENGQIIAGATTADYTVPNTKGIGLYTYIRQAKSAECSEWQSSNEFTVTVFDCAFTPSCTVTGCIATFIDPRDGKRYKTVVMPDGKTWFAQNLNYTKDLVYNAYVYEANGRQIINGIVAIGSYWCPAVEGSVTSGSEADCRTYGALYTWETAMMVDGKYTDETKTSSAWDESWISPYYITGTYNSPNAKHNNARGGTAIMGGGRGICPLGWHIPTAYEWAFMLDKVDGDGSGNSFVNSHGNSGSVPLGVDAGRKLRGGKETTTCDACIGCWYNPEHPIDDQTGFNLLPSGANSANNKFDQTCSYTLVHSSTTSVYHAIKLHLHATMTGAWITGNSRYCFEPIRCVSNIAL